MYIDQDKCIKCCLCVPYCPMGCIDKDSDGSVQIDFDECVECEICKNSKVCKKDALTMQELDWPRVLRNQFSNPLITHPKTGVPGRGTEEMKTNDVTGRLKRGKAGIAIEMGRPGTGTWFDEVQTVAMAVAPHVKAFAPENPVTVVMEDKVTGKLRDDVLAVKSLSAIIEFELEEHEILPVLEVLEKIQKEISTVFSLDIACRLEEDESCPIIDLVESSGYTLSLNGKTNVGLGRPLASEDE